MGFSSLSPSTPCSDTCVETVGLKETTVITESSGEGQLPQRRAQTHSKLHVQDVNFYCTNQWALGDFTATQDKSGGLSKGRLVRNADYQVPSQTY